MITPKGGGPAFPISLPGWGDNGASGMTLVDWYVAHITKEEYEELSPRDVGEAAEFLGITKAEYKPAIHWPIITSRIKFAIAEAMLAERKKRGIGT